MTETLMSIAGLGLLTYGNLCPSSRPASVMAGIVLLLVAAVLFAAKQVA